MGTGLKRRGTRSLREPSGFAANGAGSSVMLGQRLIANPYYRRKYSDVSCEFTQNKC
ncbi:hypothetical protein Pla100_08280 [Neorhodopirellula pilleata]|uniref:Uncharacterized protein n=1 Tax=Neorhodopirellula pilleata TaxID=2714738 RepID=A0A5C6AV98_9BACT|nr:hypothetical protein Pla100_08280 [Neorhodopirellula pilleata]